MEGEPKVKTSKTLEKGELSFEESEAPAVLSDLREELESIRKKEVIGEGYAGKVFETKITLGDMPLCAKIFRKELHSLPAVERIRRQPLEPSEEFKIQNELWEAGFKSVPVPVGFFTLEDGTETMVMERIRGYTFAQLMEYGGRTIVDPPYKEFERIMIQLNREYGVLHRDLHPGNIMLQTEQDSLKDRKELRGKLYIIDFGTAKRIAGGPTEEDYRLTIGNSVIKYPSDRSNVEMFKPRRPGDSLFKS